MNYDNKRQKNIDIAVVVILPVIAAIITFFLKTNYLISILLFFGTPSLYLAMRNSKIVNKSAIFALIFGTAFYWIIEPVAYLNNSWIITETVFPFKFLGLVTIDSYFFALLWAFYATLFYKFFFESTKKNNIISHRIYYFLYSAIILILVILIFFYTDKTYIYIPYFYLISGGLFAVVPLVLFLYNFPSFWRKFLIIGVYFTFLMFLFEAAALSAGQWVFPTNGNFIKVINFFGNPAPVEELVIWIIIATPALVSYYEFLMKDKKIPRSNSFN
ncbi:MAG: hypothetical protein AABX79_00915 [Nanoarchaeota archaeon]